jgi:integrase
MKKTTNLYHQKTKDGVELPIWWMCFKHPRTGKYIRKSTKTIDKSRALQIFTQEYNQAYDEEHFDASSTLTVKELFDWTWDNYWCFKPCADRHTKELALRPILKVFGDRVAASLTPDDLREFMRERIASGRKVSTVKRDFTHLKVAYGQAIKNKMVKNNPVQALDGSTLNEEHLKRNRVCTPGEIESLLAESSGTLHDVILFALNTGLRKGQIENLKWADINFREARMGVSHFKGGKKISYNVPLFSEAFRVLDRRKQSALSDFVFTGPEGFKIPEDGLIHAGFARLVDRLKIPDLHFHDLRHTFATAYYRRKRDLLEIRDILGHKSTQTTERYLNLSAADYVNTENVNLYHNHDILAPMPSENTLKVIG